MECNEAQRSLNAYIDDEMDPRTRSALDDHLRGCNACREELASMRALSFRTSVAKIEAPMNLRSHVTDGISSSPKTTGVIRNMKTKLSIAAVAVIAAGVGFVALRPSPVQAADLAEVRAALKKQKQVRAVTVDAKNKVVCDVLLKEGKLVVDKASKSSEPFKLAAHDLQLDCDTAGAQEFTIIVEGAEPGNGQSEPFMIVKEESADTLRIEQGDLRKLIKLNKETKLPLTIEVLRKRGANWLTESRTKFSYSASDKLEFRQSNPDAEPKLGPATQPFEIKSGG